MAREPPEARDHAAPSDFLATSERDGIRPRETVSTFIVGGVARMRAVAVRSVRGELVSVRERVTRVDEGGS